MLQPYFPVSDTSELQINGITATENLQLHLMQASRVQKGFLARHSVCICHLKNLGSGLEAAQPSLVSLTSIGQPHAEQA